MQRPASRMLLFHQARAHHPSVGYSFWAGLGRWASSKDPILQRYGVGALSRMSTSSPRAFRAVVDSGCLPALVAATASDDAQAQCFAAGAIGECSFDMASIAC